MKISELYAGTAKSGEEFMRALETLQEEGFDVQCRHTGAKLSFSSLAMIEEMEKPNNSSFRVIMTLTNIDIDASRKEVRLTFKGACAHCGLTYDMTIPLGVSHV